VIRRNGRATCQAIDAAGFLDPINQHVMHVVMLDKRLASQQDKAYALLRAIDMVRQDIGSRSIERLPNGFGRLQVARPRGCGNDEDLALAHGTIPPRA
jgi:hypothetical protein